MRKLVTFAAVLALAGSALAQPKPAAPSADDLARRAIAMMAGPSWEKARYFEYTFAVEHTDDHRVTAFPQRWDRVTGDYRVSGRDPKGNDFVVVMNSSTRKGRAWLNGEEVKDSRLENTLELGYRRFVNDTFWLLMPLRMLDPGVQRAAEGDRTDSCGRTWDLLKVMFPNPGSAPGDTYWVWINHDSGLVDEWDMKLQGSPPEEPPVTVMFHDYGRFGGLLISTRREVRNRNQIVRLDELKVSSEVPKGAFAK